MSRLKSTRGASRPAPPAARGATGGRPGVFVQTPRSDIYVVMLVIALVAILTGVLLLVLVMGRYDFSVKATAMIASPPVALAGGFEIPATVHL